jgi:hypothetical protein
MGSDTSVYIGCFTREYDGVLARDSEIDLRYAATGTGTTMLANRLSWFYDFHGPSMTLDTACSSSLGLATLLATVSRRENRRWYVKPSANEPEFQLTMQFPGDCRRV